MKIFNEKLALGKQTVESNLSEQNYKRVSIFEIIKLRKCKWDRKELKICLLLNLSQYLKNK